jgi:hypothetical protein
LASELRLNYSLFGRKVLNAVSTHADALTPANLAGVDVVLISNSSAKAVKGNAAPAHFTKETIAVLRAYIYMRRRADPHAQSRESQP